MLRKFQLVVTAIGVIALTTVNAGTMGPIAISHGSFYVGAGLGSDTVDFTQRARVFEFTPGEPVGFDVINKTHLSATGVFGTLFVGYGATISEHFYLAGEVNGNISSTKSEGFNHEFVHLNFSDTQLKIKNSIGISALPGYQLNPNTLFYGRLGLTNSKIQQETTDISLANFSFRRNGFRYGLGIQQMITDRVALRMDYSRIAYKTFTTSTFDPVGHVTKDTQLSPNQQLVEFGVILKFA